MGISENAHQAIRFFSLEQILQDQSKSHVFYLFCGLHQVKRLEALHAGAHSTCSHAADFFRAVSHACGSAINIFHYRASFHYPDIHSTRGRAAVTISDFTLDYAATYTDKREERDSDVCVKYGIQQNCGG